MVIMQNEIKILENLKLEKKKVTAKSNPITSENTKCVAKNCIYKGLNIGNKDAVGVCAKCGYFEHFGCVKIKTDDREEIKKGNMKYFCSNCFSKNPSIGISCSPTPARVGVPETTNSTTLITHSTHSKQ